MNNSSVSGYVLVKRSATGEVMNAFGFFETRTGAESWSDVYPNHAVEPVQWSTADESDGL